MGSLLARLPSAGGVGFRSVADRYDRCSVDDRLANVPGGAVARFGSPLGSAILARSVIGWRISWAEARFAPVGSLVARSCSVKCTGRMLRGRPSAGTMFGTGTSFAAAKNARTN